MADLGVGIPRRCGCGSATILLTSQTRTNPGRKFYRCAMGSGPIHVFKWMDEAHDEELALIAERHAALSEDINDIKEEIADLKIDVKEIVTMLGNLMPK